MERIPRGGLAVSPWTHGVEGLIEGRVAVFLAWRVGRLAGGVETAHLPPERGRRTLPSPTPGLKGHPP